MSLESKLCSHQAPLTQCPGQQRSQTDMLGHRLTVPRPAQQIPKTLHSLSSHLKREASSCVEVDGLSAASSSPARGASDGRLMMLPLSTALPRPAALPCCGPRAAAVAVALAVGTPGGRGNCTGPAAGGAPPRPLRRLKASMQACCSLRRMTCSQGGSGDCRAGEEWFGAQSGRVGAED